MTLNEFKAWLEGFSESFDSGIPNPTQWEKILAKLDTVQEEKKVIQTPPYIPSNPIPRWPKDPWEPTITFTDDKTIPLDLKTIVWS